jgi:galactonate dehydratase
MPLGVKITRIPDPDGHNPALLLKGDWLIVEITDGHYSGYGESSHSRDDDACEKTIRRLFNTYVKDIDLSIQAIEDLSRGAFSTADTFVAATAMSGIDQALYDLVAKREGQSVWRLFTDKACRSKIPVYATINRALTTRTLEDYAETVAHALEQGFSAIKCAPFERVNNDGDQVAQSEYGLSVLEFLRKNFPDLSIRVDFHERFHLHAFRQILPALDATSPFWLEAPLPIGPDYSELKSFCQTKIALGELYFGRTGFKKIAENSWADVIMPDVKHVGGFGALADVTRYFAGKVEVSPHNPSGPVSTVASLHAAAISPDVTSLEVPLIVDDKRAYYLAWMDAGCLAVPEGIGWGVEFIIDCHKLVKVAQSLNALVRSL